MTQFTILLSGEITATGRLKEQVHDTRVIAADSGIRHCDLLEINPELWVGDFDSSDEALGKRYRNVERQKWPTAKDLTDGEIAIREALERGATSLLLIGAHGGRLDYQMQHILLAVSQPCPCLLSDGRTEAYALNNRVSTVAPGWPEGTLFSVLAVSALEGVHLSGCRWPLDDVAVPQGSGWTMSNEVTGDLHASITSGQALLIAEV